MKFTYDSYIELINLLKDKNYFFSNYFNYDNNDKVVIFRHDIDNSLEKALKIAEIEHKNNITSTFFVLLSTDFYNIFSKKSNDILKKIMNLGHTIGLHFDEKRYNISNNMDLEKYVQMECDILSISIDNEVNVVSMHRPSKYILDNDIQFNNVINSYSKKFFNEFKYLSDSRMFWRENVFETIKSNKYDKLHILTHAFWYSKNEESVKYKLNNFINSARNERYYDMEDNITDLDRLLS